jgi:hypothetical protein
MGGYLGIGGGGPIFPTFRVVIFVVIFVAIFVAIFDDILVIFSVVAGD